MKVCTTNGLQPTLWEAAWKASGLRSSCPGSATASTTERFAGRCAHGGHPGSSPSRRSRKTTSHAMIDLGRLSTLRPRPPRIVCEEVCLPPRRPSGSNRHRQNVRRTVEVKQPRVDLELCIGCGICETKCPVLGSRHHREQHRRIPLQGKPASPGCHRALIEARRIKRDARSHGLRFPTPLLPAPGLVSSEFQIPNSEFFLYSFNT